MGPQLDSNQFRRAIGTAGLAGLQESDQDGAGSIGWIIQMVMADYEDDAGKTRVSVTNTLQVYSQMPTGSGYSTAGVTTLAYNVSILAAIPE